MAFKNRQTAGQALARALLDDPPDDPLVLALPRGGIPVALPVAEALGAPLDLVMVRKIGVPQNPELAAAAVVNGDQPQLVINEDIAGAFGLDRDALEALAEPQLAEIARRRSLYLHGRPQIPVTGRGAIIVDDGLATGATARAAIKAVRAQNPARLILAVPVAPRETLDALTSQVDQVVCLQVPTPFRAVGAHYGAFPQVADAEVTRLMDSAPA